MLSTISFLRKCRIINPRAKNLLFSTDPTEKDNTLEFQSSYDSKQIANILKIINQRSEVELCNFNLSKQRIKKIEMRKQKQGEFKSLEEILELDGFGVKVLENFCDSILIQGNVSKEETSKSKNPEDDESFLLKKKQSFVSPAMLEGFRQSITSCVAIHVDLNCIAWTKLTLAAEDDTEEKIRPIHIDEWFCFQFGNDDKKRSLSDLIQILIQLKDRIPEADTYIFEAQQSQQVSKQPGNPIQMNVNVQKSQFFAMVCMLMASRDPIVKFNPEVKVTEARKRIAEQQRVFLMRPFLASKLYKIFIGNERVSTEHVINEVLRFGYVENEPTRFIYSSIDVPSHLRQSFNVSDNVDREYMGQSMLIGLSFLKLCILKCPQSIKILNKRINSKT